MSTQLLTSLDLDLDLDHGDTQPGPGVLEAPWSLGQVASLREFQLEAHHPYCCPNCSPHWGSCVLQARPHGLTCSDCLHTQTWAHAFQLDWSWRDRWV